MHRLDLDVADPTAGIPTIPQGKRSRALSDPEISRLLRWRDSGAVSRTIGDVLRLTRYTGARSGEVCAMRSIDVDIDAKTRTHTQGKTGDVSVTPLSAPAVEILRNRPGAPGLPVRDRRIHPWPSAALSGQRLQRLCLRRRDAQVAGSVGRACGGNRCAARQTGACSTPRARMRARRGGTVIGVVRYAAPVGGYRRGLHAMANTARAAAGGHRWRNRRDRRAARKKELRTRKVASSSLSGIAGALPATLGSSDWRMIELLNPKADVGRYALACG